LTPKKGERRDSSPQRKNGTREANQMKKGGSNANKNGFKNTNTSPFLGEKKRLRKGEGFPNSRGNSSAHHSITPRKSPRKSQLQLRERIGIRGKGGGRRAGGVVGAETRKAFWGRRGRREKFDEKELQVSMKWKLILERRGERIPGQGGQRRTLEHG